MASGAADLRRLRLALVVLSRALQQQHAGQEQTQAPPYPAPTLALASPGTPSVCSAPLLASALQRHLHWNRRSPIYSAWHLLDQRYLYPLFGGRAPRGTAYHSPPPSPGRRVIQQVMGQGILKRMAGEPGAASEFLGSGGTTQAASSPRQGPRLSWGQQQPQQPAAVPARLHSFRLWPAPTEPQPAAADCGRQSVAAGQAGLSSTSQQGQQAGGSSALEGEHAAAAWCVLAEPPSAMLPLLLAAGCSYIEPPSTSCRCALVCALLHAAGLFSTNTGRLDSASSQPLDWRDT